LLFVARNLPGGGRILAPPRVISETNKIISRILTGDLRILKKIAGYVVDSGGKRIRPLFTYYMGRSMGIDGAELIRLGALLEIVHAASLLHDDVVDGADERRGQPTGAKLFGNKQSILGGDHLLSSGLKYLNTLGNPHYMHIFTDAIKALSAAELLQMQQHFDLKTDLKTHARVVDGKTAVLFRAAGALVAVNRHEKDYYRSRTAELGELFGRYFQRRDDYLDYFDAERLKKKGLQDFAGGVVTRPLAMLVRVAKAGDRTALKAEWDFARRENKVRDAGKILDLMKKYGIEELILDELGADEEQILAGLGALPEKEPREVLIREFQKILAVRSA